MLASFVQRVSSLDGAASPAAAAAAAAPAAAAARAQLEGQQLQQLQGQVARLAAQSAADLACQEEAAQQLQAAQAALQAAQRQTLDKEEDCQALKAALAAVNSAWPAQQQALQRQLDSSSQQLAAAHGALSDVNRQLAVKQDCVAFAERRAAMLERQLEAVKEQLADARARHHHCSCMCQGACEEAPPAGAHHDAGQQQQQRSGDVRRASLGEAAAAATPAAAQPAPDPLLPQRALSPLVNGLAAVRTFVGLREAEANGRLKDALAEAEGKADNLRTQLTGLTTVLAVKMATANRLEAENKQLARQLRQAEEQLAAAAGEHQQQQPFVDHHQQQQQQQPASEFPGLPFEVRTPSALRKLLASDEHVKGGGRRLLEAFRLGGKKDGDVHNLQLTHTVEHAHDEQQRRVDWLRAPAAVLTG